MSPEAKGEIIRALNEEYIKQLQNANSVINAKKQIKAGLEAKLENLYRLVENGLCDNITINRIKSLQEQISSADEDIKNASIPLTVLTPDEIDHLFLLLDQKIAEDNTAAKRIMVDTFVEKVTVTNFSAELVLSLYHMPLDMVSEDKNLPKIEITSTLDVSR